MNRMTKRLTMFVLGAVLLGLIAYGAARLVGAQRDDGSDPAVNAERLSGSDPGLLLVPGRDDLSVCVDRVDGTRVTPDEVGAVASALEEALGTVPELPTEYADRQVVSGCPSPNAAFGTPVYRLDIPRPIVDVPSEHRLVLFFVSDADYASTFPDEPYVRIAQERMCEGDVCRPVTDALYVPLSVSDETLELGIKGALNLLPYVPDIDPTIEPTRCLATREKDGRCDALRF